MNSRLAVKSALICAAVLIPISCKPRKHGASVKDVVDGSNALFGTGRAAATLAAKRNCFKSDVFSEEQGGAMLADDNSGNSGSSSDSNSTRQGGNRLIKTKVNQLVPEIHTISTSTTNFYDRTIGGDAGMSTKPLEPPKDGEVAAKIPSGILKFLNVGPEFTAKIANVLNQNHTSKLDTYIVTVKYQSHKLAIQPDENDFKSDALGLLDGKENSFKRFLSACGDEFLSMKEYGGDITIVFGASSNDHGSTMDTNGSGHLGATLPLGISGQVNGNFGNKTGLTGNEQISNFIINENALNLTSSVSCAIPRSATAGETTQVVHEHPFIPKNKTELDELLYCLPRWIEAVPTSFNYRDFSTVFPLSLDQSVIDTYQTTYLASKKIWSDKLIAEEKAAKAQVEKEQKEQEALKPGKQLPDQVVLEVPKLKVVTPVPGAKLTGTTPAGRQARLDATRRFIRENMVFALPSQCAIAGCDGYNEVDGACTNCQEAVQAVSKIYGGINFCRDNTDCREGKTCQAASDAKTGVCR